MLKKLDDHVKKELEKFASKVNEAILNDKFELYKGVKYQNEDDSTITIKVLDSIVEIWNANENKDTGVWRCYKDEGDFRGRNSYATVSTISFKVKPGTIRKKLRALCENKKCPTCGK